MSDNSDNIPQIDFDTEGFWDFDEAQGPAIHVPDQVKNIVVTQYRIEWLNMSIPDEDFYAKNHMVAVVEFAQSTMIDREEYSSARLSMEFGPEFAVPGFNGVRLVQSASLESNFDFLRHPAPITIQEPTPSPFNRTRVQLSVALTNVPIILQPAPLLGCL